MEIGSAQILNKGDAVRKKKLGQEIGKAAAEKSRGLFSADDWQCNKCSNVNWARRQSCNMCNAPKYGDVEERTGYGGGYNDRGVVEYIQRSDSDDEFDEFGRRKKKKVKMNNDNTAKRIAISEEDVDEEEDDEDDEEDLSKYDLSGWSEEEGNKSSNSKDQQDGQNSSHISKKPKTSRSSSSSSSRSRSHSRSRSCSRSRSRHRSKTDSRSRSHSKNRSRSRSRSKSPSRNRSHTPTKRRKSNFLSQSKPLNSKTGFEK